LTVGHDVGFVMDVTKQAASAARQDWSFSAVKIGELMIHSFTASRLLLLLFYFILNNTQDNRYREHYR